MKDDAISRQTAIDALEKIDCSDGVGISLLKCDAVDDAVTAIKALPSAQPEIAERTTETAQNVSDRDLISRKAAMNRIDEALARVFVESRGCGEYILRKLPSVKPERNRGHWVGIDDEPCDVYECDRCGTTYDTVDSTWDLPNYCPNCGADMRKDEQE